MKKIILLLVLTMTCEEVAFKGIAIISRCYNDEAICYIKRGGGISCIKKEEQ